MRNDNITNFTENWKDFLSKENRKTEADKDVTMHPLDAQFQEIYGIVTKLAEEAYSKFKVISFKRLLRTFDENGIIIPGDKALTVLTILQACSDWANSNGNEELSLKIESAFASKNGMPMFLFMTRFRHGMEEIVDSFKKEGQVPDGTNP